jgi:hypothetical protein
LCNRAPQRLGLDVVREAAPAVDLHDGQPLAIRRLESRLPRDVHLTQGEAELVPKLPDLRQGPFAEMATLRVVDDDLGYG